MTNASQDPRECCARPIGTGFVPCGRASTHFYLMPSGRLLGCCSEHGYGYEQADLVIPMTEAELCALEVHAA